MDIEPHRIKQQQSHSIGSGIVCMSSCPQFFSIGCLDDSVRVWSNKLSPFQKDPIIQYTDAISGVIDIVLSKNSTRCASLSLDSTIKIWDLDTNSMSSIQVPMLNAWKICFVGDSLVTCGDLGKIFYYDVFSREIVKKINLQDTNYLTAINYDESVKKVAIGNINGDIFLLNNEDKQEGVTKIKSHYKTIRQIEFNKSNKKLLACSDDTMVSESDLTTLKLIRHFSGHLQRVNCIKYDAYNPNIFYSCSLDKTIKIWDSRKKEWSLSYTMQDSVWAIQVIEKSLLAGGELGTFHILNIQ